MLFNLMDNFEFSCVHLIIKKDFQLLLKLPETRKVANEHTISLDFPVKRSCHFIL